ncbi:S41 family peptidase [Patescibacteria group bacterium]
MTAAFKIKSTKKKNGFFRRFTKIYLYLFLILIVFIFGFLSGRQNGETISQEKENGQVYNKAAKPGFLNDDVNFNLFWDTWDIIESYYVDKPVSETELLYGAMAGSVASLGDPHSIFFDPETAQAFEDELGGSFEGIGAEIAIKNDRLTIVAPLPGTPAESAGLQSGDKVYAIDGEDTTGISLDYAVNKIRGPKGSEVVLTVSRNGLTDLVEIKIIRNTIKIESVKWEMLDNQIAHIKLRYFNLDTASEFNRIVMEIIEQNPQAIILDLRNNPGGYLDTAISVASEWVDDNIILYERTAGDKLKEHKDTRGTARFNEFTTVVLVNQGSASGSEIVAGALRDHDLATVIGEKTFGKGSVQNLFDLKDGSAIKLTIAKWLTPNENTIEGDGITPDIEIELSEEDFNGDADPQLDKAIEVLLNE